METMGPYHIENGLISRRLGFNSELRSLRASALASEPKPRLVGGLIVKNEAKHIGRALEFMTRVADCVVVIDNGSTDTTPDICKSFPVVERVEHHPEQFHEGALRNRLLDICRELGAQWVLGLDADEVLEEQIIAEMPALLRPMDPWIDAYAFKILNFWRGEQAFRVDGKWQPSLKIRLFRLRPHHVCNMRPYHVDMNPINMHWKQVRVSSVRLLHYGYADYEDARRKHDFYVANEKDGVEDYSHLVDEAGLELETYQSEADMGRIDERATARFLRECFFAGRWLRSCNRKEADAVTRAFREGCEAPAVTRALTLGRALNPFGGKS